MKRLVFGLIAAALLSSTLAMAAKRADGVMSKQSDGTYVVNTTTLCPTVKGYKGATPLEVTFRKNKIVKVKALRNQESPSYFKRVRDGLLAKWEGMTASKAAKADVDGVTGATFSSRAVKANVKAAADYYKKHR